jgi:AcrR family transcriptional regulator
MPRTGLRAEQIKEKAIEATMTKMREVGFEKVRLTDIAKELKVSHAALYTHFKDKSELLDAVSRTWLHNLDQTLESICRKRKDPLGKIHDWALAIHRAKVEKVRLDPELFNAFDLASEQLKPFVQNHLENLHRQLLGLVEEAIANRKLPNADPEAMTEIIGAAVLAFHHPRLVALYIKKEREALLRQVIDSILRGLNLKKPDFR